MSVLLTSGFGNYTIQEAFAISAYSSSITGAVGGDSGATTNIVVTFTNPIYTTQGGQVGGAENEAAHFTVAGSTVNTANIESRANGAACGPGTTTVTLVLAAAISTSATPQVNFNTDAAIMACNDDAVVASSGAQTPTDGLSPVFSSAATGSSTSIVVTMNEGGLIEAGVDTPGAWAVAGTLTNAPIAVTNVAVAGTDVTLTLDSVIVNGDTVTIAYTNPGGANEITDAAGNEIASFGAQAVTNNVAVVVAQANKSRGGSGCNDCEAPTLGIDKSGQRLVSNGFTYNGHSVDVERFFTPYPLIKANVGQTNKADFKIYENEGPDNIKHFSFAFGLGNDQIISESKAMIELDIDWDGTETVTVTDPENALDNVKVETSAVSCDGDERVNCLGVTVYHTFRAPLDFNIVATDVWDNSRNSWQNYYNHGIEVVGESLNPAKEYDGIDKGHIYHLTETSKTTAVDEFGNSWTLKYGLWDMDYIKNYNNPITLSLNGMVSTDNGFAGSDQFGTMYYLTETSKTTAVDMFGNVWLLEDNQWSMDKKYSKMILDSTPMGGYTRADSEFGIYKYGQFLLAENKLNEIIR